MNHLILVRHGQSLWNKQRRFTGWADIDLTEQGRLEAKVAGELIKKLNIDFDAYFSSKLKRSINSLKIILEVLKNDKVKTIEAKELNERHYGNLTSLNKDETIKKYGEKQVKIWRRSYNVPPPPMDNQHPYMNKINSNISGESLKDTFDRVVPYYLKKIEPLISTGKNILIVFHGNSCRALLKKILNISEKKIIEFEIPTGNPLLITFKDSKVQNCKYLDLKRCKKIPINF